MIVYVIQSEGSDYYKIGKTSKDINERLLALQTGNPNSLKVVCVIPCADSHSLERFLHTQFANKRVRNEWFELDSSDVRFLYDISSAYSLYSPLKSDKAVSFKSLDSETYSDVVSLSKTYKLTALQVHGICYNIPRIVNNNTIYYNSEHVNHFINTNYYLVNKDKLLTEVECAKIHNLDADSFTANKASYPHLKRKDTLLYPEKCLVDYSYELNQL